MSTKMRVAALATLLAIAAPTTGADARRVFASDLFRAAMVRRVVINPEGRVLAAIVSKKNSTGVLVQQRGEAAVTVALHVAHPIWRMEWLDDARLLVTFDSGHKVRANIVRVTRNAGTLTTSVKEVAARGWLVDPLVDAPDEVLWARVLRGRTGVYRLPISMLFDKQYDNSWDDYPSEHRISRVKGYVVSWVADQKGEMRAALRIADDDPPSYELMHRGGARGRWRSLASTEDEGEVIWPMAMAANGEDLIVGTSAGRDKAGLFEFDVETTSLGKEIYTHADVDVAGALLNKDQTEVIGVSYDEAGLHRYHYFDSFTDRYQRSLEHALPGEVVHIVSTSADMRFLIVVAESSRNPGVFYLLDTETSEAAEVGRVNPWIEPRDLVEVMALKVPTPDGLELDAFFAAPKKTYGTKPPLLVNPHGGPIGVQEGRRFDPLMQYLASQGIAVLQVNYRGSGGYGKSFLDAGKRQWARGIEDDIDAAVDRVIAAGWVDPDRICIAGVSYGGYSALMSVVRRPDRYRCAASLNGPTDIPLLFNSSDFAVYERALEEMASIAGDPRTEYADMIGRSPVYRASEIRTPVFLAHGTHDRRVDVEHYHRLRRMLEAHANPAELLLLEGAPHSLNSDEWITFAVKLVDFLDAHVGLYQAKP